MGLMYALFYFGRYNLTKFKNAIGGDLMDKSDFGTIFGVGATVYMLAFLVNGPLTDKIGGKKGILVGAAGVIFMNLAMGLYTRHVLLLEDPSSAPIVAVLRPRCIKKLDDALPGQV